MCVRARVAGGEEDGEEEVEHAVRLGAAGDCIPSLDPFQVTHTLDLCLCLSFLLMTLCLVRMCGGTGRTDRIGRVDRADGPDEAEAQGKPLILALTRATRNVVGASGG